VSPGNHILAQWPLDDWADHTPIPRDYPLYDTFPDPLRDERSTTVAPQGIWREQWFDVVPKPKPTPPPRRFKKRKKDR
jgi:hypothetical protein